MNCDKKWIYYLTARVTTKNDKDAVKKTKSKSKWNSKNKSSNSGGKKKKQTEKQKEQRKNKNKMTNLRPNISIIILNVNGLYIPLKKQRLAKWIKEQDSNICCL